MQDTRGFTEFYRRWWDLVWSTAVQVLGCHDEASDAAQRVFVRLWGHGAWRGIQDPARFLRLAARREAISALRRWRGRPLPLTPARERTLSDPGLGPEEVIILTDRSRWLRAAISRLPVRCRLVSSLVFMEGFAHQEVAKRLGISVKAVEKQVARGRQQLLKMWSSAPHAGASTFSDGGG